MTAQTQTGRQEVLPSGLLFSPDFLTLTEENELLAFLYTLEFRTFQI